MTNPLANVHLPTAVVVVVVVLVLVFLLHSVAHHR